MARKPAPAFEIPQADGEDRPAAAAVQPARPARMKHATETPPYRIGKRNLGVWIPEEAHRQVKMFAAQRGDTVQEYVSRLLNAEFARCGAPEIA